MSHHRKRQPRRATAPTLVALMLNPEFSITERLAVESLRGGYASPKHFNDLLDCRDMLLLGGDARRDEGVLAVARAAGEALMSIRQRKTRTGKLGATGDELQVLACLADLSEDFWKRQSGDLFAQAHKTLMDHRAEQAKAADAPAQKAAA